MTYDELKEYFEYSTWKRAENPGKHICYSCGNLYVYFYQGGNIEAAVFGGGSFQIIMPIDPTETHIGCHDICLNVTGTRLSMNLPRDTERIEREREEEYFKNRE